MEKKGSKAAAKTPQSGSHTDTSKARDSPIWQGDAEARTVVLEQTFSSEPVIDEYSETQLLVDEPGRKDLIGRINEAGRSLLARTTNLDGDTFLHEAVRCGSLSLVGHLISVFRETQQNISLWINRRNNNGDTALHLAVMYSRAGKISVIFIPWCTNTSHGADIKNLLLQEGCDPSILNEDGLKAFDLASLIGVSNSQLDHSSAGKMCRVSPPPLPPLFVISECFYVLLTFVSTSTDQGGTVAIRPYPRRHQSCIRDTLSSANSA